MPQLVYDSRNSQSSTRGVFRILYTRRVLLYELTKNELLGRYKRSAFGILWSFVNPLLISIVIYFVFGRIFNGYMPGSHGYASWVMSGVLLQVLLLTGITIGSSSLQQNVSLISRNRIEPMLYALSSAIAHVIHFAIGATALIPLGMVTGQHLSLRIFLLPLFFLFVMLWLAGIGMIIVGWFMRFDDALYLFNATLMIISYLSPFLYPLSILSPRLRSIVEWNPITDMVVTFRWMFYSAQPISLHSLSMAFISPIVVFIIGIERIRKRWNDYVML